MGWAILGAVAIIAIRQLDGNVAEVVIVHAPIASEVTTLESYLKSKYGL